MSAIICLFHLRWLRSSMVLRSWCNSSPCSSLSALKFYWESIKMTVKKREFDTHAASSVMKTDNKFVTRISLLLAFLLLRKFSITVTNGNLAPVYLSFIFLTSTRWWICVPSNTPALIFSNDKAGRTETMFGKHSPSVFNAMTNYFVRPSLMCKSGNRIFFTANDCITDNVWHLNFQSLT